MARGGGKPQPTITDDRALGAADIQRSIRFFSDDGQVFQRTPGSAGNRKKWTFSAWIKRSNLSAEQRIFGGNANASHIYFASNDELTWDLANDGSSSSQGNLNTDAKFTDTTSWLHLVCALDTDESTADNRMRIYVNGAEITDFGSRTNPSSGYATNAINDTTLHTIGRRTSDQGSDGMRFDGYMAEINFIDGQQYDPSYFGFTDPQTGIWLPKRYEGTYGTNGFYLDFSDNSSTAALGIDKSPNGNDFANYNFSLSDSVKDTPTNAFCTMNLLDKAAGTQLTTKNGSLTVYTSHGFRTMRSTMGASSGKWYWEARLISWASSFIGITSGDEDITGTGRGGETSNSATIRQNTGNLRTNGSDASYGNSQADGDILGFALDMDNGKFYIAENGTWYNSGDPANGTNAGKTGLTGTVFPSAAPYDGKSCYFNFGQDDTFDGNETSQGNTDGNGHGKFKYAPPTGFLALCTSNLPASTSILRPKKHFDTLIYTGNGSADRDITGLEFKPDFVWIKNRDDYDWHMLQDVIRGANKVLYSNTNDGEDTDNSNGHVNHFIEGGFNVTAGASGNTNKDTEDYVAWCWKAGGAAVSNSDGTVTSSISVNKEAGFSIVTYTGNATANQTVGHGLGAAPNIVITKRRNSSDNWQVYWNSQGSGQATSRNGFLNLSNAMNNPAHVDQWGGAVVTSTTFPLGASDVSNNGSGDTYVSYCWTGIPGYSKFGEYTGSGNSDGTFVHCGFRPAFLIAKKYSGTDAWMMWDSTRDSHNIMHHRNSTEYYPETTTVSSSSSQCDFLSNGFKWRGTSNDTNGDGDNYVFWAFAEQPGTTSFDTISNAR